MGGGGLRTRVVLSQHKRFGPHVIPALHCTNEMVFEDDAHDGEGDAEDDAGDDDDGDEAEDGVILKIQNTCAPL